MLTLAAELGVRHLGETNAGSSEGRCLASCKVTTLSDFVGLLCLDVARKSNVRI